MRLHLSLLTRENHVAAKLLVKHIARASQLAVMTQEFKRGISGVCSYVALAPLTSMNQGHEIVERVLFGKATWDELWVKHDFFHRYHNYLQVVASAGDQDTALKWSVTSSSERALTTS